jgi:patatin-like phospholipase/acyl hydrolase
METPEENQGFERAYRVLSLDGGGMRGIYTGAFLARLTDQFARIRGESALDLGLGFDLITGTSTGAIVGCALAVGRPMAEIVDLYREHGPKIFPHRIAGKASVAFRATQGSRYVRKGEKALREALQAVVGDTTMLDVFGGRGISLFPPS